MGSTASKKFAALASGDGALFMRLLERQDCFAGADLALFACDGPCKAMSFFAEQPGVATLTLDFKTGSRETAERRLLNELEKRKIDFVISMFGRILSPTVTSPWAERLFGLHLSLLPMHPKLRAERSSFRGAELFYGGTLFMLTDELDAGPILGQFALPKNPDMSEMEFNMRLHQAALPFLADMIGKIARQGLARSGERWRIAGAAYGASPFNPALEPETKKFYSG